MIAKVTRGARMSGLMTYLVGPGKSNEHTEQHLVAGDSAVMTMYGYDSLDKAAALEIAASLDAPRREFGVDVTRQVTRVDPDTGEVLKERVDASVWHCSLSIAADEGQLSDEKWGQIAQEFVDRMGFTEVSGKAACRWVAVRHGLSEHGNDHVHIAVSLVREDGTKASTHNDFHRAMKIVRELESEFELRPLRAEREQDMPQRQESRAARESAQRRGAAEVDSTRLERTVRAAASASMDEGEFVRRMRREGVLIRPRFETGRNDVVTGYSVALRPEKGAQPVWHSGLRLARDLTLPELRKGWPDTPESASAAVEEWRATRKNPDRYVPAHPGREESEMNPEFFNMYAEDMTRLHDYIATIDPDAWAHVARETSGAYAAWSRRLEPVPGPLARTSRTLARSAQLRPSQSRRRPVAMPSMVNTTALILAQASKGKNAAAKALLLRQLSQTTVSILRAVQASGDARRASELAATVKNNLRAVRDGYAAQIAENGVASLTPEERAVKQRADLAAGRGGPLPTKLTPTAQPELAQPAPRTTGAGDRDATER